jgi:hypothetical protein
LFVTAPQPLEHQLSAAKANLRSLQDKLRLSQAQVTWCQNAIAESEKNIARIEEALALEAATDTARNSVAPRRR